ETGYHDKDHYSQNSNVFSPPRPSSTLGRFPRGIVSTAREHQRRGQNICAHQGIPNRQDNGKPSSIPPMVGKDCRYCQGENSNPDGKHYSPAQRSAALPPDAGRGAVQAQGWLTHGAPNLAHVRVARRATPPIAAPAASSRCFQPGPSAFLN